MIDYIKVLVYDVDVSKLKRNRWLDFFGEFNYDTGEVKTRSKNNKKRTPSEKAEYRGLTFTIYQTGSVFISGSLHKYWNDGEHNYNDFNLISLFNVLRDIQEKFNIRPHQMKLNTLEIGVNITTPCKTDDVLMYCFLHSTKPFRWCRVQGDGRYIQADHFQYLIKIYNKAREYRGKGYDIKDEILRFEVKYKKLEKLNRLGISTIQDLIDYGLENFVSVLVEEWQKVLFYDFTIRSQIRSLPNYKNPLYWHELIERKSKASLKKHRRILSKLIEESSGNIRLKLSKLIEAKGNILSCKGVQIDRYFQRENSKKGIHTDPVLESIKKVKGIHIDPLIILSIPIPLLNDIRVCIVTGLPLFEQKDNSFMLSHTGLYFYRKHYPEIFEMLKRKYLTDYWGEPDLKKQVKLIAHNIRIKKWNSERKQKRIYPLDNYRLFDIN